MHDLFLNPHLDMADIQAKFAAQGYVYINDWLKPEVAEALHQAMVQNKEWDLRLFDEHKGRILSHRLFWDINMTPEAFALAKLQALSSYVAKDFAYMFFLQELPRMAFPMGHFAQWIQTDFRHWVAEIVQEGVGEVVELVATNYTPGCFLRSHSDAIGERKLTFVANFTPNWCADYGGVLQLLRLSDNTIETYVPTMNVLMLFRVTNQTHWVTQVATYAPANRYAVSGWILNPTPQDNPSPAQTQAEGPPPEQNHGSDCSQCTTVSHGYPG